MAIIAINSENVGKVFKALRKGNGLTLQDVHTKTGLSVTYLSDIERGGSNPSMNTLETLSAFYGYTLHIDTEMTSDNLYKKGYADGVKAMLKHGQVLLGS